MRFPGWRQSRVQALASFGIAAAAFFCTTFASRAADDPLDSVMYRDPELPLAKVVKALPSPDLINIWLVALRRPEADYQSRAALTIIMAHREGMKGLEVTIDPLIEILVGPNHHAFARLAAVRALVELDARQAAKQMLEQAPSGDHDLRALIEPALASWKYPPARELWLERLRQPDAASGDLVLAMRGLAALGAPEAASRLTELVDSSQVFWPIRLEAARALGAIRTSGSEAQARRLLASASHESADHTPPGTSAHLAAAWLLHHHQGDEAAQLLQTLARDAEPAVAFIACQRLLEIDSKLVLPVIDPVLASPDAKVRSLGVETLFREATLERLRPLADKLNDPHPDTRLKARQALEQLASRSQFKEEVIRQGMRILAGQDWRGLEQATILLTRLDHKPSAGRVAELVQSERPEVFVAAAWGLRRLAVPETLPAALKRFQEAHRLIKLPGNIPDVAWDAQLSQLAQFMGQSRYRPADATLRREVPRSRRPGGDDDAAIGQETRAASIWALGYIHEGKPDLPLVKEMEARLNDAPRPFNPGDDPRVRSMSAISLARMKAKDTLPSLRRFQATAAPTLNPVAHACSWAIQQLTGEAPPPPGSVHFPANGFPNWLRSLPPEK
jgi:hypothetical protein